MSSKASSSLARNDASTSTSIAQTPLLSDGEDATSEASTKTQNKRPSNAGVEKLKGSAAGVASGLTKLTIGHPFDTIKTRMQCSPMGTFTGPLHCLKVVTKQEGLRALYKGASPPAVGWAISDAVLLGSLHNYRLLLAQHTSLVRPMSSSDTPGSVAVLSVPGHAVAGVLAGITVALVASPIELLKVKLQMQLHPTSPLLAAGVPHAFNNIATSPIARPTATYTSPIGFAKQIYKQNGITGFWHATGATMAQRAWFGLMFAAYDVQLAWSRQQVKKRDGSYGPRLNEGMANFLAGGSSSTLFWTFAYPFDNVKNRLMSDSITNPKFPSWLSAARSIWAEAGIKSLYRGFVPCILRAFPTNASALFVWEYAMRAMNAEKVR